MEGDWHTSPKDAGSIQEIDAAERRGARYELRTLVALARRIQTERPNYDGWVQALEEFIRRAKEG